MTQKISAILITQNEEKTLERCLEKLRWCDEIVIVDSGSIDKTLQIARRFTDKIFTQPFKGFGPQKQAALHKASHDWILSVDADEVVSEDLAGEIRSRIEISASIKGYCLPRKNFCAEKWIRFGGQYPDYSLRLFLKNAGHFTNQIIHERVVVKGNIGKLTHPLYHYAFKDLSSMIEKINRYSQLAAEEKHRQGKKTGALTPLVHFVAHFMKDYILRLGFLDGNEGLNVALIKSLGAYFKYAKLLEMQKRPPDANNLK